MISYSIPKAWITDARNLAEKIYKEKLVIGDKFKTGSEKQADSAGFQAELSLARVLGLKEPGLFAGAKRDEFDFRFIVPMDGCLRLLRFDVKNSNQFWINLEQFKRKSSIDAFLFCSIDYRGMMATNHFLRVHGWILRERVPLFSSVQEFPNGSKAYKVPAAALKDARELFVLRSFNDFNSSKTGGDFE